jgi:hypothetical protein
LRRSGGRAVACARACGRRRSRERKCVVNWFATRFGSHWNLRQARVTDCQAGKGASGKEGRKRQRGAQAASERGPGGRPTVGRLAKRCANK